MKGRKVAPVGVYSAERVAAARRIKEAAGDQMRDAARQLPREVRLSDGRVLKAESDVSGGIGYRCRDGMVALASYDVTTHGLLLHVSISYAERDPRWKDLRLVRAAFFPKDVDVIQVLPRDGEYVNVHQHCFHLFQAPETWQGGWNV